VANHAGHQVDHRQQVLQRIDVGPGILCAQFRFLQLLLDLRLAALMFGLVDLAIDAHFLEPLEFNNPAL
jgi:hypothetical protein